MNLFLDCTSVNSALLSISEILKINKKKLKKRIENPKFQIPSSDYTFGMYVFHYTRMFAPCDFDVGLKSLDQYLLNELLDKIYSKILFDKLSRKNWNEILHEINLCQNPTLYKNKFCPVSKELSSFQKGPFAYYVKDSPVILNLDNRLGWEIIRDFSADFYRFFPSINLWKLISDNTKNCILKIRLEESNSCYNRLDEAVEYVKAGISGNLSPYCSFWGRCHDFKGNLVPRKNIVGIEVIDT